MSMEMQALKHQLRLGDLVRDNLSIIMTFIYSKQRIDQFADQHFTGSWKELKEKVYAANERRALRACFEMALYLRALDDETHISELYAEITNEVFGVLFHENGTSHSLPLREVANKIIHAERLEWDFGRQPEPVLICKAKQQESRKWTRAEIDFSFLLHLGATMIYE